MSSRSRAAIGLAFALLSIPAAGGAQTPSEDASPSLAAFWEALGDTTLTRLMNEALRENLDVRAAEARVAGARSSRTLARLDLAPTVEVAGGYTRQRLPAAAFPGSTGSLPDQDLWDAGVDAFWEIDLFGRVRRNVRGQGALVASSREDLRDAQIGLSAELARTYFELRGAQGQLEVAQRNADNQRRTLDLTQQRLEAGRGTAFDTERARAQLSFTLAAIPSLESRIAAARHRIAFLAGRPPATIRSELASSAPLPSLDADLSGVEVDSLVRLRPDVVSAERRLTAQRAFTGSAKAEYLPRLSLSGTAGWTSGTFDSFGARGTSRYAVGPVLTWPALNLGRVKARVDASKARESEAEARYRETVLRAMEEMESAMVGFTAARSRLARLDEAAAASERAAELARLRYQEGVADFLQVLDAERTMLAAQDQ
ncbi:MAG: efflux transporter outer membrane subunit, partial [Gemmatimonadales bacterium]